MREIKFFDGYVDPKRVLSTAPLLIAILLLMACSSDEFQDLQDFVKNSGADFRGQVEPAPDIKPYEPFAYDNSAALPDPFKPRKQEKKDLSNSGLNQPDIVRPKQELEEFALESLKMVGYLHRGNSGHAIIRSGEGKLHRVKVGNYMGMNFGQITSITETEIKVKEMVQDGAGDWLVRESSLQLVE